MSYSAARVTHLPPLCDRAYRRNRHMSVTELRPTSYRFVHRRYAVAAPVSAVPVEPAHERRRDPAHALPPRRARGRGDPHHPRGRRRVRAAGAAVLRRQGLDRDAAPRREGVLARRSSRSRCCTSTPATTSPRCSSSATAASPSSACGSIVASRAGLDRRRAASSRRPGRRHRATGCRPSTLLDAIEEHQFDAVFGGARRDEEKARAKERDLLLPRRVRPVGPAHPAARAVEPLQRRASARASTSACSRSRTGPSSTSGSTSSARSIELPSIYFAHEREVFRRDGMLLRRVATWSSAGRDEEVFERDGPLPHRRRHDAAPAPSSRTRRRSTRSSPRSPRRTITERGATRADDRISEAAMEDRKREGYF